VKRGVGRGRDKISEKTSATLFSVIFDNLSLGIVHRAKGLMC
jgi:hypothetical protein